MSDLMINFDDSLLNGSGIPQETIDLLNNAHGGMVQMGVLMREQEERVYKIDKSLRELRMNVPVVNSEGKTEHFNYNKERSDLRKMVEKFSKATSAFDFAFKAILAPYPGESTVEKMEFMRVRQNELRKAQ